MTKKKKIVNNYYFEIHINIDQKKDEPFFDKHKIKWTILGIVLTVLAVGIEHYLKIKFI